MVLIELNGFAGAILATVACSLREGAARRITALAGSLCFLLYGSLIGSLPVLLLQVFLLAYCGSRLMHYLRNRPRRPDLGTPLLDVLAGSGTASIHRSRRQTGG